MRWSQLVHDAYRNNKQTRHYNLLHYKVFDDEKGLHSISISAPPGPQVHSATVIISDLTRRRVPRAR